MDGMGRNTCAMHALDLLTPGGLLILDDTGGERNRPARDYLESNGLGRIDFWGFRAGSGINTCTSAFSRDFNVWLQSATSVGIPSLERRNR